MKDKYNLKDKEEGYHDIELYIKNKLNPNAPELMGKDNRQPFMSNGFWCEEDYNRHKRRYSDRSKAVDSSTGEYEG